MDQVYVTNDKSLDNNVNLLHSLAKKGFARLQAAHVAIDYDDVFQEMCVAFCKASKKFDETRGAKFSTYCYRACLLEFNRFAEKLIATNAISESEFNTPDGDEEWSFFDALPSDDPTPEEAVEQMQEFKSNIRKLPELARFMVAKLVYPPAEMRREFEIYRAHIKEGIDAGMISSRQMPKALDLDFIGRFYNVEPKVVDRVKGQLEETFGVKLGKRL